MENNDMITFAQNNRTTTHFRDLAIQRIQVAYRCMEYFSTESFPLEEELHPRIMPLCKTGQYRDAAETIIEDDLCLDGIGCSLAHEQMTDDAAKLLEYLHNKHRAYLAQQKENRRQQILRELAALDAEEV